MNFVFCWLCMKSESTSVVQARPSPTKLSYLSAACTVLSLGVRIWQHMLSCVGQPFLARMLILVRRQVYLNDDHGTL